MPSTTLLPYADVKTPEGVTELTVVRILPDVRTIYVPMYRRRISIGPMLWPAAQLAGLGGFAFAVIAILAHFKIGGIAGVVGPICSFVAVNIALKFTRPWFPRRLSFEVTAFELRSTSAGVFGTARHRWNRSKVRSVAVDLTNQLVISLVNDDPVTMLISPDPAVTPRVAEELTAALAEIIAAPASRQRQTADPSAGLPPGPARTVLQRLSASLSIAAIVGAPFSHGWSFCLLVPAAVLIGTAMGSR